MGGYQIVSGEGGMGLAAMLGESAVDKLCVCGVVHMVLTVVVVSSSMVVGAVFDFNFRAAASFHTIDRGGAYLLFLSLWAGLSVGGGRGRRAGQRRADHDSFIEII
mmetsp:Transcript_11954/g.34995  ORF Transcript_11954/g.34995 Transcript_11954/m.34995 type:complete len:106 (-) Transcript_11954:1219-1536(-)